jgi:hypothetical protein
MSFCSEQKQLFGGELRLALSSTFIDDTRASPQKRENRDLVEIYDVVKMEHLSSGLYSKAGFLFLAVVGGADYSVRDVQ